MGYWSDIDVSIRESATRWAASLGDWEREAYTMATWRYDCWVNCLFGCDCTLFVPTWRDLAFPIPDA